MIKLRLSERATYQSYVRWVNDIEVVGVIVEDDVVSFFAIVL